MEANPMVESEFEDIEAQDCDTYSGSLTFNYIADRSGPKGMNRDWIVVRAFAPGQWLGVTLIRASDEE
jgi:hypothetical protein